jgi:hypothetical protein
MTEESLELMRNHCDFADATDEDIEDALNAAENQGYADGDGWSNNPSELIGFVNGYLYHKNECDPYITNESNILKFSDFLK